MSTEVATINLAKVPAYLRNAEPDATTKALAGNTGMGRRISIEGGVFRMIVDGKQVAENEDRAMNIVVVAAADNVNRQFYEGTYVKGKVVPPTCWSADGKVPSPDAETPQHATCDGCPQNISGSGEGTSRACRYQQRLAVVLEGEIDGPVYQLAIPATSLFGKGEPNGKKMPLQAYAKHLIANNTQITSFVTEMRFDTAAATPKLTFSAARWLTEEEHEIVKTQGASSEAKQAITLTVFKMDTKAKLAEEFAPEPPAKAAKVKPAPVVAPEVEVEPKVVKAEKPAAPVGKKPVSAVLAEWDD